jgi:hypothetical protein
MIDRTGEYVIFSEHRDRPDLYSEAQFTQSGELHLVAVLKDSRVYEIVAHSSGQSSLLPSSASDQPMVRY